MTKKQKIIPNIGNVGVSPNEYMTRFSINRNIDLLLENDKASYSKAQSQAEDTVIHDFSTNDTYDVNDLVWFKDRFNRLWLLRKIVNFTGKSDNPADAVGSETSIPDFEQHGWRDENEHIDLSEYGVYDKIGRYVKTRLNDHEEDEDQHEYGVLIDGDDMDGTFLKADASNADPDRGNSFFPYKTVRLASGDVVLNGYARVWDCGLLEYDIVYRMGYCGTDSDGYEILTCNNVEFSVSTNRDNQKYFNSVGDSSIFAYQNSSERNYSRVEDTIQRNRNDYVNTYFAHIQFPSIEMPIGGVSKNIRFANNQYMVFSSNVMSQDRDFGENCVNTSANQVTYCNRSTSGITAMLITFPDQQHFTAADDGYNATHGGLVSNTFHCTVIGKYATD